MHCFVAQRYYATPLFLFACRVENWGNHCEITRQLDILSATQLTVK